MPTIPWTTLACSLASISFAIFSVPPIRNYISLPLVSKSLTSCCNAVFVGSWDNDALFIYNWCCNEKYSANCGFSFFKALKSSFLSDTASADNCWPSSNLFLAWARPPTLNLIEFSYAFVVSRPAPTPPWVYALTLSVSDKLRLNIYLYIISAELYTFCTAAANLLACYS
jgi:hypothetical protein